MCVLHDELDSPISQLGFARRQTKHAVVRAQCVLPTQIAQIVSAGFFRICETRWLTLWWMKAVQCLMQVCGGLMPSTDGHTRQRRRLARKVQQEHREQW